MTKFQTSWTKIPNIQTISESIKSLSNIKFRNSKLEVWPWEPGSIPSSLCRTQNQASLTNLHSQNKCTLSWTTPHARQLGVAALLNLLNNLSLLAMMLFTTMKSISLALGSNMDWRRCHTRSQSASNLNTIFGEGKVEVKLAYSVLEEIFFKDFEGKLF